MYGIAKQPAEEREILFGNTASKMGMNAAIIEKDFWVCLTLDYLFHHCKWKQNIAFKGGTSLSKVYGLIDRFSEDIDLILDWRVIGYGLHEPWNERSGNQQQKFIAEANEKLFDFLETEFLPQFRNEMSELIHSEVYAYIDEEDRGTVRFVYPQSYSSESILQEIRLEIGPLAAWTPTQYGSISSFAAEVYPGIFEQRATTVLTTTAERTFWEKATILHQEAYRPTGSRMPERYSRHYYDLYSMAKKGIYEKALEQSELLEQVAEFKRRFYPRKWAKYEEAELGSLMLVPASHSVERLRADYKRMREMIYGDYPDFDEMMRYIVELEHRINNRE